MVKPICGLVLKVYSHQYYHSSIQFNNLGIRGTADNDCESNESQNTLIINGAQCFMLKTMKNGQILLKGFIGI